MKLYKLRCQTILVFFSIVLSTAGRDYKNNLTKLWSLSSANSNRTAVVTKSVPSSYSDQLTSTRRSKESKPAYEYMTYTFKPRAIPLSSDDQSYQLERNFYYSQSNKPKPETLFPGDYIPIVEEKSIETITKNSVYNPLNGGLFQPTTIPLLREQDIQKRSLDVDEEPSIEKPEGFVETNESRRSFSYILGDDNEDENEEDRNGQLDDDLEETEEKKQKKTGLKPKKAKKKLSKYMLPLLLAYKLKYFALFPLLVKGLLLLIGASGLAGFFFALFAAVMGLQKGGY